jgi:hypothetical protein
MKPESAGQTQTLEQHSGNVGAAALFGVLAFSLFGDTHVRRTGW